jgi:1,4-dihydroxy-2-naphthoate octaprenyltransferase
MQILFLLPLAIATLAIYIRSHSQEEIVRLLSSIIAVISVCVSFALTPGSLQMLVMVIGFWQVRRCCRESRNNSTDPC